MIPSTFVVLDEIPLTDRGKIDFAALPCPIADHSDQCEVNGAPRDWVESKLTEIWEDVLNVRPIGIRDNYFELGGQSFLSIVLFERISNQFKQNLPLSVLIESPTIERLAEVLRSRTTLKIAHKSLVPIQTCGSKPPLFLIPPAGGSVMRFAEFARRLGNDQPVYGLESACDDPAGTPVNVETMATTYLKEICQVQPVGPYLIAGICFGGFVAWEIARQFLQIHEEVALVSLLDPAAPSHGPTWTSPPRTFNDVARRVVQHLVSGSLPQIVRDNAVYQSKQVWKKTSPLGRQSLRRLRTQLRAQNSYVGQPYSGRVALIQSEETFRRETPLARWSTIATGQFHSTYLPGTTHRDMLLGTQAIPELARVLNEQIEQALCSMVHKEVGSRCRNGLQGASQNDSRFRFGPSLFESSLDESVIVPFDRDLQTRSQDQRRRVA
ncbi:MAG: hypothetical protein FJ267_04520 [Planctomycetes bacterium]|nr:hypothetical protein [Planctomycetota bacterium]